MGKRGEINWESSIDIYTLPCVNSELSSVLCEDPEGWGWGGNGREGHQGGDIRIPVADSC